MNDLFFQSFMELWLHAAPAEKRRLVSLLSEEAVVVMVDSIRDAYAQYRQDLTRWREESYEGQRIEAETRFVASLGNFVRRKDLDALPAPEETPFCASRSRELIDTIRLGTKPKDAPCQIVARCTRVYACFYGHKVLPPIVTLETFGRKEGAKPSNAYILYRRWEKTQKAVKAALAYKSPPMPKDPTRGGATTLEQTPLWHRYQSIVAPKDGQTAGCLRLV